MNAATSRRPRKNTSIHSFKPELLESRTLLSAWSTVDTYQLATGKGAASNAIAVDGSGNAFAAGWASDSAGHNHGIVREKLAGGTTWTTIEDYGVSGASVAFYAAAVDRAGVLYVAGGVPQSSGDQWLVLEKPASGNSFSLVDSYSGGLAQGLAVDASGNVFAVGQTLVTSTGKGKKTTTTYYWTVRKQAGGLGTFTTVDNAISSTTNAPYAWGVTSISTGASAGLYVVDIASPAGNCATSAFGVDPSGTVYAAGDVRDSSGVLHWIVQSTAGPTAPASATPAAAAAVFSSTQITSSTDSTDIFHHRKHRR